MDFPIIVGATEEYYRNVYADPDLGPIFKGVNMVVLRNHVSYFLHNLSLWDSPMSENQLKYLTKVHMPLFESKGVCQMHFDIMLGYLRQAMEQSGAEASQLDQVERKLKPLRDVFPPTSHARVVVQSEDSNKGEKEKVAAAVAAVLATPAKQPKANAGMCPVSQAPQDQQRQQQKEQQLHAKSVKDKGGPAMEKGLGADTAGEKGGLGKWLRAMVCGSSALAPKR